MKHRLEFSTFEINALISDAIRAKYPQLVEKHTLAVGFSNDGRPVPDLLLTVLLEPFSSGGKD